MESTPRPLRFWIWVYFAVTLLMYLTSGKRSLDAMFEYATYGLFVTGAPYLALIALVIAVGAGFVVRDIIAKVIRWSQSP